VLEKQSVQANVRILVALFAALVVSVVFAVVSQTSVSAADANTLKVSPVRTDVVIQPGQTKKVQVTVSNLTKEAITLSPIENDFTTGDERGTPALILDANAYAPTHSLKRFMVPLENITVPAEKSKTIEVIIGVPKDAQAGGYFGAVRFAPASPDGGGQVNLSASVASLILLTVPGDIVEQLQLTDFSILQNDRAVTNVSKPDNLKVTVRFQNKGNVQIGPFGKISVKNGNKVVYSADFNNKDPRDVILPDSARRWDIPLEKIGTFGRYEINATLTYGQKNQTIEVTKVLWVIPPIAIVIAAISLVILIGLIILTIFLIRRSRRGPRIGRSHRGGYRIR